MIDWSSLVISVPAAQFRVDAFKSSVFPAYLLQQMPLPEDLAVALDLVLQRSGRDRQLQCLVRPEMFTHGASHAWMSRQLGRVTDHLALSDGATVKLVTGLRNHLFTYSMHQVAHRSALDNLLVRVPECLGRLSSQINSHHVAVMPDGRRTSPPHEILMPSRPGLFQGLLWNYPFYLNPYSVADSVHRMTAWGEAGLPSPASPERVTYLPLTETALQRPHTGKLLAARIARALFQPRETLIVGLPSLNGDYTSKLSAVLACIHGSDVRLPRARARNVFFLSSDPDEAQLMTLGSTLSMVLPSSYPFWRYTRDLYRAVASVSVLPEERSSVENDEKSRLIQALLARDVETHVGDKLATGSA